MIHEGMAMSSEYNIPALIELKFQKEKKKEKELKEKDPVPKCWNCDEVLT